MNPPPLRCSAAAYLGRWFKLQPINHRLSSARWLEVGHVANNFILLHPSGDAFVFCLREDLSSRMAPFMRVGEGV